MTYIVLQLLKGAFGIALISTGYRITTTSMVDVFAIVAGFFLIVHAVYRLALLVIAVMDEIRRGSK